MPRENLPEMKRKLVATLSAIAAEPKDQLQYLRNIGFQPGREVVDELAQELSDYQGLTQDLRAADLLSEHAAQSIDSFVDWLGTGELAEVWDRDRLSDPRWDEIRRRAREALTTLEGPG